MRYKYYTCQFQDALSHNMCHQFMLITVNWNTDTFSACTRSGTMNCIFDAVVWRCLIRFPVNFNLNRVPVYYSENEPYLFPLSEKHARAGLSFLITIYKYNWLAVLMGLGDRIELCIFFFELRLTWIFKRRAFSAWSKLADLFVKM